MAEERALETEVAIIPAMEVADGKRAVPEPVMPARALSLQISVDACVIAVERLLVGVEMERREWGGERTCEIRRLAGACNTRDCRSSDCFSSGAALAYNQRVSNVFDAKTLVSVVLDVWNRSVCTHS